MLEVWHVGFVINLILIGFALVCGVAVFFLVDVTVVKPRLRRRMHKKRVDDSLQRLVEAFAETPDEIQSFTDKVGELGDIKSMAQSYSEQHELLNELHWRKQFIDGEIKAEE